VSPSRTARASAHRGEALRAWLDAAGIANGPRGGGGNLGDGGLNGGDGADNDEVPIPGEPLTVTGFGGTSFDERRARPHAQAVVGSQLRDGLRQLATTRLRQGHAEAPPPLQQRRITR